MTEEPISEEIQEIENIELSLEEIKEQELQDAKDKYLRLLAEMENTRKRLQKEKVETAKFAVENVITEFLVPMDNFEKALNFTVNMSSEVSNWAKGFQMILEQFKEVLASHNISSFSSQGQLFDPRFHEALETEETDSHPDGEILQEYAKGYKSKDRTIRPARVKVATKPAIKESHLDELQ